MNQITPSHNLHTSSKARARTKKRYRQQAMLKFAGVTAITFAGLALVSLLYSIVSRAVLARSETYITLDLLLDESRIDPTGKRAEDTLYKASYMRLVKKHLRQKFDGLKRSEKRKLYGLVSATAPFELRDHVVAHPELIGTKISFDLLADDDVDLYVKGKPDALVALAATGRAHLTGGQKRGEEVTILAGPNAFEAGLDLVKLSLLHEGERFEHQALAQKRASAGIAEKLRHSLTQKESEVLRVKERRYDDEYESLMVRVSDLRERATRPGGHEKLDASQPSLFVKINGGMVKVSEIEPGQIKGQIVRPLKTLDEAAGGDWSFLAVALPEDNRKMTDNQIIWLEHLRDEGRIKSSFNWHLFTSADASEPEEAGIVGGLLGTFWTMLVTFFLSFPIGVAAALYLEEFAPKNGLTRFVEVNINNLAAVPSIVFGLLGLAVFVNFFGMPYSSSLVGGLVLSLMTLPTIIIASRAAIKAVPPSIKEAALGIGASKMQTVFQHVLPLAMPGILTGSILGMAQALGETAPLLMIGMVAFIVDPPMAVTDAASSLPVLIYLWADRAELAFDQRTAAAILVLLFVLVLMNILAIILRKRFERRW